MIYVVIFCTVLFSSLFFLRRVKGHLYYPYHYHIDRKYFIFITILLSLFIGLRGIDVGSDTATYFYHFSNLKNTSYKDIVLRYNSDFFFYYITKVFAGLLRNYNLYLIITSLIYLIPIAILVYKKSEDPVFSYFLFFSFGLFTFSMSTLRQSISIGLCISAFLMMEKKKLLSALMIALAAGIHFSAIVFFPVLLIKRIRLNILTIIPLILAPIFFLLFFPQITNFLISAADIGNYNTEIYVITSVGGIGMILFLIIVLSIGIMPFKRVKLRHEADFTIFFMMVYCALLIFISTRFNLAVMRLYYYYFIFIIVYIPNMTARFEDILFKSIIKIFIIMVAIYFLLFQVFSDPYSVGSKLLPYVFFWS